MGAGASGLATASAEELRELFLALPLEQRRQLEDACGSSGPEIPKAWGWPKEPYDPEDLRLYVLQATKPTQQEAWDDALAQRSMDGKKEDFVEEKAFANLLLNKEPKSALKGIIRLVILEDSWQPARRVDPRAWVLTGGYRRAAEGSWNRPSRL